MEFIIYFIGALLLMVLIFFAYGREKTWLLFYGQADLGAVDFTTFTPTKKPNHALFCPQDYCTNAKKYKRTPVFSLSAVELKSNILKLILAEPLTIQVAQDDKKLEYRFVQYTPLMRFPDSIRLKIIPLKNNRSTLAIYSQSQMGNGDLGVNFKRLSRWLQSLQIDAVDGI
ncbi:MAG: DUF1499 domain-containing protein [Rhizobiales bacterium]|nr:DUF1499 domain-containing protein [Hyphomicrobiales bacterium]NRB15365.1 DUF1499 domain-containing protein [Hyphomicrobiales bacterium]